MAGPCEELGSTTLPIACVLGSPARRLDMTTTSNKVLFVLTSHDHKGNKPSGFFLSEATHPHLVLANAGYEIEFVSPKGGKAPVDPDSLDLDDAINAKFWNNPTLRNAIEHTRGPADVKAEDYAGIFFAG